jgi:signal transduction histidine kinase
MTPIAGGSTVPKVSILLVDDQPANLQNLKTILEDLGQNLVEAESGAAALRLLSEDDFAVVLLDLQVAGLDGFETARSIRSRERSRQTPIIFLSSYESPDLTVVKAYALGAVDYLRKPLLPEVVRAKVAGFVDLLQKTQQVNRQAELLRQLERSAFEHQWAEAKQKWELENLREESRRKNDFLAILAHELRNPLAPIRNSLQLLRLKGPIDAETHLAQDVIERQVEQMTRLVDDLLDISRITHGKIILRKELVDTTNVIERAVEMAQPLIDSRHHTLTVETPSEAIFLDADPIRLAQILANLLNNAAKYTDEGGRISISVGRANDGREGGDDVLIKVRDTGIGIPAELLPQIFNLFFQENASLDRSRSGLGIGLTLVRNLVEMHGGRIQAFSPGSGKGSEFVVRLPARTGPSASLPFAAPVAERPAATSPRRILVVDDNVDSAKTLAILLRHFGHDVQVVHDGPAALAAARSRPPEVVLLDIGLPHMSGLEVARRLRGELGLNNVLLVAMTGYGQIEDRKRSQEAGFNAHLVKPLDMDDLWVLLAHPEFAASARGMPGEPDGVDPRSSPNSGR